MILPGSSTEYGFCNHRCLRKQLDAVIKKHRVASKTLKQVALDSCLDTLLGPQVPNPIMLEIIESDFSPRDQRMPMERTLYSPHDPR
jgi:hypothetical protein